MPEQAPPGPPARVTLFAGPTACGLADAALAGARLRPPIRRGDVDSLLQTGEAPGIAVICDGIFQTEPAVSHGEICRAIDAGWQVWGVSGIGAIRAHEMRAEGVHGYGYVYSLFGNFSDFTDDEMCRLHQPDAPYQPLTEALVNLRFALAQQGAPLGIAADAQSLLLAQLGALWFGERTQEKIRSVMVAGVGIDPAQADALLSWLRGHRIQTMDLAGVMGEKPWGGGG